MSNLVDFEDLGQLDSGDLRAVLDQATLEEVLTALAGTSASFRQQLLTKLPPASALRIEAQVHAHGPIPFELVQKSQRLLVEILCRLSRGSQVAFDDPEDMVA